MEGVTLWQGDCLELMKNIPDGSVDLVLTDPPYGTTACKWDSVIPFEPMWEQLNRIIKPNGAICLFGSEPFTSRIICSNLKGFKYRWDWNKKTPSGMVNAKYRPLQQTEDIAVFTRKGEKTIYNPQMVKRETPIRSGGNGAQTGVYFGWKCRGDGKQFNKIYEYKNPTTLIEFNKIKKGTFHPTQKPVDLLEYLIRTYTNEGETVLDFTMGSGSTGVACVNTGRKFIGIELDQAYFDIAKERIEKSIRERG